MYTLSTHLVDSLQFHKIIFLGSLYKYTSVQLSLHDINVVQNTRFVLCASSRVLDERLAVLLDDVTTGEFIGKLGVVLSDLHVSVQARKYDQLLKDNGYDHKAALEELDAQSLLELGVPHGHCKLLIKAFFPVEVETVVGREVSLGSNQPKSGKSIKPCAEFPAVTATGVPSDKSFRAWIILFLVYLRGLVAEETLEAVRLTASNPAADLALEWTVASEESSVVFDALVSAGKAGLPADLLLSFPPATVTGALGLVALRQISRMVNTLTDEGAAVMQGWFNQPPPVTVKWMLGPALIQWERAVEQLSSYSAEPPQVSQRLSLLHLVSKIPELQPEIAALRVQSSGSIAVPELVAVVRAKAEAFSLCSQYTAGCCCHVPGVHRCGR